MHTVQNRLFTDQCNRSAGFTLIELMIVLVLLGIFAALALPAFGNLIESNRVQSASSEIKSLLQNARSDATSKRTPIKIIIEDAEDGNKNIVWTAKAGDTDLYQVNLPSSTAIESTKQEITFNPDGSASDTISVQVSSSKYSVNTYTINVTKPGVIKSTQNSASSKDEDN